MSTTRSRTTSSLILLAVLLFVALMIPAMHTYPGGTAWDHGTHGSDFWLNYLCDYGRRVALNGAPNPVGAALTQAAMLVLALGLFLIFWQLPDLLRSRPRLGVVVRVLGTIGVIGALAVALLPAGRHGSLHAIAIVVAAVPGLIATLLAVLGLVLDEPRPRPATLSGSVMVSVSGVDFFLFARHVSEAGPGPTSVAILERIALSLVLLWMCVMAIRLRREPGRGR